MPTQITPDTMTPRDIAELALQSSRRALPLIEQWRDRPEELISTYFKQGRELFQCWLRMLPDSVIDHDPQRELVDAMSLDRLESCAAELFAVDLLLRVWGTILIAADRQHEWRDVERVVLHVMNGVRQARDRLLVRLLRRSIADEQRVATIDRLRRRCERWTDALIGPLAARFHVIELAYDSERAIEFGSDVNFPRNHPLAAGQSLAVPSELAETGAATWLMAAGISVAFGGDWPTAQLSEQARAIIRMVLEQVALPDQA